MNIKTILLAIIAVIPVPLFGMESIFNPGQNTSTKEDTILWLKARIQPINGGRFKDDRKPGAKANCTFCAEECVKVLSGAKEPQLVPAKKKNFDITYRKDDSGTVIYHEAIRPEQADLIPFKEFTETIDLLEDKPTSSINLNQIVAPTSLKYITSSRNTIVDAIKSLAGSAVSQGTDKTLSGLVYYYYKNVNAGHLANFYRDKEGNVFFIDSQSEEITQTPPTKILDYEVSDTMFFYPLAPKGGYYIKRETLMPVKEEKKVHEKPEITEEKRSQKRQKGDSNPLFNQDETDDLFANLIKAAVFKKDNSLTASIKNFVIFKKPDVRKNSLLQNLQANALWYALITDDKDLTGLLMAHEADPSFVNNVLNNQESFNAIQKKVFTSIYDYKNAKLLIEAARYDNLNLAKKVFQAFKDTSKLEGLNLVDDEGNSPLMLAVLNKNVEMIYLLNKVFLFNGVQKNKDGLTDLDLLAKNQLGNLGIRMAFESLLDKPKQEQPKRTVLPPEVAGPINEQFEKMIETALKNKDISPETIAALKEFVITQKPNLEKNSLEARAEHNCLWYAFCTRDPNLTRFFIAHYANPQEMISFLEKHKSQLGQIYDTYLAIYTNKDPHLLLFATQYDNIQLANAVIQAQQNTTMDTVLDDQGNDPLMIAIMHQNNKMVSALNKIFKFDNPHKNKDGYNALELAKIYFPNLILRPEQKKPDITDTQNDLYRYNESAIELVQAIQNENSKTAEEFYLRLSYRKNLTTNIAKAYDNLFDQQNFSDFLNKQPIELTFKKTGSLLAHHIARCKHLDFLALLILSGANLNSTNNEHKTPIDYLTIKERSLLLDILYWHYIMADHNIIMPLNSSKSNSVILQNKKDIIYNNYVEVLYSVYQLLLKDNPNKAFKWLFERQIKNRNIPILSLINRNDGTTFFHHAAETREKIENLLYLMRASKIANIKNPWLIADKKGRKPFDRLDPITLALLQKRIKEFEIIEFYSTDQTFSLLQRTMDELNAATTQCGETFLPYPNVMIKIIQFCNECLKHNTVADLKTIVETKFKLEGYPTTIAHVLARAGFKEALYYIQNLVGNLSLIEDAFGKTYIDYLNKYQ